VGSVIETFGNALVPVSNLVLAGSLYHGSIDTIKRLSGGKIPGEDCCRARVRRACCRSCVVCLCGRDETGAEASPGGTASSGSIVSVDASGPVPSSGLYDEQLSWSAIGAIIVLRLVLAPAASFGLYALFQYAKVPLLVPPGGSMAAPEAVEARADALIWIIALLQSCTPSAQFALVVTQKAGLTKAAETLSLLYLIMYPLSLLTMPGWIILALSMVFGS
jgi:hypothetical protein